MLATTNASSARRVARSAATARAQSIVPLHGNRRAARAEEQTTRCSFQAASWRGCSLASVGRANVVGAWADQSFGSRRRAQLERHLGRTRVRRHGEVGPLADTPPVPNETAQPRGQVSAPGQAVVACRARQRSAARAPGAAGARSGRMTKRVMTWHRACGDACTAPRLPHTLLSAAAHCQPASRTRWRWTPVAPSALRRT